MAVDGGSEHVVLEGRDTLSGVQGAEERGCVGVGQLPIFELGWVVILARFLQQNKRGFCSRCIHCVSISLLLSQAALHDLSWFFHNNGKHQEKHHYTFILHYILIPPPRVNI